MAQYFHIHPETPQQRLIKQAVLILQEGGVVVYPTDSCYALACRIGDREALQRIQRLRVLDDRHKLTLACQDLSVIGRYTRMDNSSFRLVKNLTPGPYTFILKASNDVPRWLYHRKRKTIGVRIPDNAIAQALLGAINESLLTTSLILPGSSLPLTDPEEINTVIGSRVDLVIDGGNGGMEPTTIIDLAGPEAVVLREGIGDVASIGS
ncbi:MAG TPA: L-threonylcarbamoyladenylate synthase [Gammaproteobacteria bacterium]|nr:L-threonylcarbamoyladenylate synthase [Gammaproteobacteria bacterium]